MIKDISCHFNGNLYCEVSFSLYVTIHVFESESKILDIMGQKKYENICILLI